MLSPTLVGTLLVISILLIIILSSTFKINTFFVLVLVAMGVGLLAGFDGETVIKTLKVGFGGTLEKIGLLIVLGTVLGILLDHTRATLSLAHLILAQTGERYATVAMSLTGFVVGLPIFCDSGFVVLSGLAVSLAHQLPQQRVALATSLATGLFGVHCLVPPHPGITAAAGILNVEIGQLMLWGVLLAVPVTVAAFFWLRYLAPREVLLAPSEPARMPLPSAALPSATRSALPIVVPIALIALKSLWPVALFPNLTPIVTFMGEPVVALLLGICVALPLLRPLRSDELNRLFDEAIIKAGPILIVTAAGGAFGEIIKLLRLGEVLGESLAGGSWGILVPFGLAALFKTAQGSSTVAVISAASIISPLLASLGLDSQTGKILALLAMGAGSMCFSHANDSYFWVIARFSHLSVSATLRSFSSATAVMSVVALVSLMLLRFMLT